MKIEKVRNLSQAELTAEELKLKKELFNIRYQNVTGQLENPIRMKDLKRDIARVKTVLREQELKKAEK